MKNCCIINLLLPGEWWIREISGVNPVKVILEKSRKLFRADEILCLIDDKIPDDLLPIVRSCILGENIVSVENRKFSIVIKKLFNELSKIKNCENLVFVHGDSPLIDPDLISRMLAIHNDQLAEYTYGEGYPAGFLPEILRIEIIPRLLKLSESFDPDFDRSAIFKVISRDVNSFDIETLFAEEDLKLRRIEAITSSWRERLIVENVIKSTGKKELDISYKEFCELIRREPLILRPTPTYCQVEITSLRNDECIYYPIEFMERRPGQMKLDDYLRILDKLVTINPEMYIEISYLGEPLLHPNFQTIIKKTLENPWVKLIVLTNGLLWTPGMSEDIVKNYGENDRLFIIFELDAVEEKTYAKIRRGDLFKVERNIRYLHSLGFKNLFVQFTRIDLNEDEMIRFYQSWEKEGVKPVIQKFNSFSGLLPGFSDYDITPLERWPCYHLEREMLIFYNGDVPKCKQDINLRYPLGNLITDSVADVWKNGNKYYLEHVAEKYDDLCSECDEYFTFNF